MKTNNDWVLFNYGDMLKSDKNKEWIKYWKICLQIYLNDLDTRTSVLGYIQRGGSPSADDVLLASRFGAHAIDLIKQGIGGRCVGIKNNKIIDMDINEACSMKKEFNKELYEIAEILSR